MEQSKIYVDILQLKKTDYGINAIGAIVKEPSINLDDSIYVDFIGEWHLSNSGLYYEK